MSRSWSNSAAGGYYTPTSPTYQGAPSSPYICPTSPSFHAASYETHSQPQTPRGASAAVASASPSAALSRLTLNTQTSAPPTPRTRSQRGLPPVALLSIHGIVQRILPFFNSFVMQPVTVTEDGSLAFSFLSDIHRTVYLYNASEEELWRVLRRPMVFYRKWDALYTRALAIRKAFASMVKLAVPHVASPTHTAMFQRTWIYFNDTDPRPKFLKPIRAISYADEEYATTNWNCTLAEKFLFLVCLLWPHGLVQPFHGIVSSGAKEAHLALHGGNTDEAKTSTPAVNIHPAVQRFLALFVPGKEHSFCPVGFRFSFHTAQDKPWAHRIFDPFVDLLLLCNGRNIEAMRVAQTNNASSDSASASTFGSHSRSLRQNHRALSDVSFASSSAAFSSSSSSSGGSGGVMDDYENRFGSDDISELEARSKQVFLFLAWLSWHLAECLGIHYEADKLALTRRAMAVFLWRDSVGEEAITMGNEVFQYLTGAADTLPEAPVRNAAALNAPARPQQLGAKALEHIGKQSSLAQFSKSVAAPLATASAALPVSDASQMSRVSVVSHWANFIDQVQSRLCDMYPDAEHLHGDCTYPLHKEFIGIFRSFQEPRCNFYRNLSSALKWIRAFRVVDYEKQSDEFTDLELMRAQPLAAPLFFQLTMGDFATDKVALKTIEGSPNAMLIHGWMSDQVRAAMEGTGLEVIQALFRLPFGAKHTGVPSVSMRCILPRCVTVADRIGSGSLSTVIGGHLWAIHAVFSATLAHSMHEAASKASDSPNPVFHFNSAAIRDEERLRNAAYLLSLVFDADGIFMHPAHVPLYTFRGESVEASYVPAREIVDGVLALSTASAEETAASVARGALVAKPCIYPLTFIQAIVSLTLSNELWLGFKPQEADQGPVRAHSIRNAIHVLVARLVFSISALRHVPWSTADCPTIMRNGATAQAPPATTQAMLWAVLFLGNSRVKHYIHASVASFYENEMGVEFTKDSPLMDVETTNDTRSGKDESRVGDSFVSSSSSSASKANGVHSRIFFADDTPAPFQNYRQLSMVDKLRLVGRLCSLYENVQDPDAEKLTSSCLWTVLSYLCVELPVARSTFTRIWGDLRRTPVPECRVPVLFKTKMQEDTGTFTLPSGLKLSTGGDLEPRFKRSVGSLVFFTLGLCGLPEGYFIDKTLLLQTNIIHMVTAVMNHTIGSTPGFVRRELDACGPLGFLYGKATRENGTPLQPLFRALYTDTMRMAEQEHFTRIFCDSVFAVSRDAIAPNPSGSEHHGRHPGADESAKRSRSTPPEE